MELLRTRHPVRADTFNTSRLNTNIWCSITVDGAGSAS
jgi:hypothetical protein